MTPPAPGPRPPSRPRAPVLPGAGHRTLGLRVHSRCKLSICCGARTARALGRRARARLGPRHPQPDHCAAFALAGRRRRRARRAHRPRPRPRTSSAAPRVDGPHSQSLPPSWPAPAAPGLHPPSGRRRTRHRHRRAGSLREGVSQHAAAPCPSSAGPCACCSRFVTRVASRSQLCVCPAHRQSVASVLEAAAI